MKEKLLFKPNRKTIGIFIVLLTALYLVLGTVVFAQEENKLAETEIDYKKDYLSYGDVWTFDSAVHTASNYSKSNLGTSSYYSNSSTTNGGTTNFTRSFYKEVTTATRGAPTGVTVPSHMLTRFVNGTAQDKVPSPVDETQMIPVITTTNTNTNTRYSVVPDTKGEYYVYAYSEKDAPTVNYAMLDSCDASIEYNNASGLPNTPLEFEEVGGNWYRAPIEVKTVRWHAVALNDPKKSGSSNSPSGDNKTYYGGQDFDASLGGGGTTYYYNQWTTTDVDYNTVIVFQFTSTVKLGPITKTGDTITITNTDPEKGNITARNIFGEEIAIGEPITTPHAPIIISGEAIGDDSMLDELKEVNNKGRITAQGENYVYDFEDTSEISVTWTKLVDLPSIAVTGGSQSINMNFFAAKTANFTHPAGTERIYNFTADFDNTPNLKSLTYTYTINENETKQVSGELTPDDNSFSLSNIAYDSIVVTFTATDKDGDTFTATCTINLSTADATAPFKVVNSYYWTWEKALAAAAAQTNTNNKRVILNANYTLPSDLHGNGMLESGTYVTEEADGRINYRIPTDVIFIIPHAADYTYVTNTGDTYHTYAVETQVGGNGGTPTAVATSVFRELTVSSGASINIEKNGVMTIGGTTNGSEVVSGAHSNVHLEKDAEINVASGGVLSSCGYIYGEGTVNTESDSTIYIPFSVLDFRGGGYTVGVAGKLKSSSYGATNPSGETALSPFIRYTMNAIQCDLFIKPGATLMGYLNLAASGDNHNIKATIIGSGEALIKMGKNTEVDITYDAGTYASSYASVGKTKIKINGDAEFGNLKISVSVNVLLSSVNIDIDTSKVNFPIPYNYDIEIASGTFTMPNSIMLLPGANVTVGEDATLNVSNSLTVYDGLHDYTCPASTEQISLTGWVGRSTATASPYMQYPSTAVLQGASFGGSGSADLIVNGTLNLNAGSKIAGIVQTGGINTARINTAANIGTSTTTQIGAVGSSSVGTSYYFVGATVRTLTGEILDTGTGNRTKIVGGQTYMPSAGAGNISSYSYTLYYDSYSASTYKEDRTEEVACILQGSWYNYVVDVYMILDDQRSGPVKTYFAHGAALPDGYYYDDGKANKATSVTDERDLYFIGEAEAEIVWADGSKPTKYPSVRNAVKDAVNAGDRIVLLKDLTDFSSVIGPTAEQNFTFDINEHIINYRSTPFTNNSGGKMTIDMNGGTITNAVTDDKGNTKYYDSPVLSLKAGCELTLLINGGSISITGNASTPLVNGGVENPGNLYIDLAGGTWEYKTGLSVPKSEAAANQHHDLTVMAPYQSKAMFNNTGTLTITDSVGGATVTTDLISNGTTLTATTPTTNYVSVIRNNAGATLNLGGGKFVLEPKSDKDGDAILSTAAAPIPMVTYSAVVLNFGDINTCEDGTALSMQGSGSYGLYNLKGGSVDLDLRGGTIELTTYDAGVAANAAMYNSKVAVVNDGEMTLRSSAEDKGKIHMNAQAGTGGALHGIFNSNNAAIFSTLTLDNVSIEVNHALSASSYGVYNRAGSKITGINNTDITMNLGQAVNSTGSATTTTTIGNITNSSFTVGTTEAVAGSSAFYVSYTHVGNITGSKFKNEATASNTAAFRLDGSAAVWSTIGDITESYFEGGLNGLLAYNNVRIDIGNITNSHFSSGTGYALSAAGGSTIKSITGSSFTSAASGGLNLGGTGENTSTGVKRVLATVGGITDTKFNVTTIGINISHADIGDLDKVIIKTQTGNGITATNGSIIGDVIDCEITSGDYDEETGTFTTGSVGLSTAGTAATATANALVPEVGNIIGSTFISKGNGITIAGGAAGAAGNAAGSKVGNIVECTFHTGAYGIAISGGAVHATGGAAAAPEVGNITGNTITSATYGISISGHAGNAAFPDHAFATVGDITGNTVNSGTISIYLTYTNAGVIEDCHLTATNPANTTGVIHVINLSSVEQITGTDITILDTSTTTSSGIYVSGSNVGDIIKCDITVSKGYAITHTTTAALGVSRIGDIVECTIVSNAAGIYATSGQVTATAAGAAPVFGNIIDTTFDTVTYGISIAGSAATTNGNAVAPTVGNITGCTFNVGSYGISISGGAGVTAYPDHAFAKVGDITGTTVNAGTSYGIYLSYADAGKIEACTIEAAPTTNNYGVLHVANRSSIEHIYDTDITVRDTSTNTSVAAIYTSASTIGDITLCHITSSKGPAISHNATAALGVSTIGDITDCTIVSGAGGIVGAGGVATATAKAAAPVIGNITKTNFDTVTYGISIGSAAANTYGAGAGAIVGNITGCTVDALTYGIQIAGGAGTAAENYKDVGFAKVGDITDTTVNSGTYSIYLNYCKGGVIEDCKLNATNPASGSYVIGNANGSYVKHIKNTPITVIAPSTKSYGIYNNGGEIELIEKSPIDAPYGIYNLNVRVTAHTTETGSTISYYGRIGTIKDMEVKVAQWALQNRGVIDEIIGECTFIAANPSAQVPWDHGTIANGNAAANTFINYNTWWGSDGNSTIWKQTDTLDSDGNLTRTVEYKWDDDHRPTIGKISGDIKIIAENTSNNTAHGVAMINNGLIREISGNVDIETYVHPKNDGSTGVAAPAYSSYALQNTSGGQIDKIVGNVKISAGAYAIQNSTGQLYIKNAITYNGSAATSGQETDIDRTYFHDYTGIGEITGANGDEDEGIIIEATAGSYAIENHARIGDITGKVSITADGGSYAIQNTTGTTINIIQTMTWPGADMNTPKTYHQEYVMAEIGTIGGGDSEILISSNGATNNTYTLQSNGRIEAILEGVTIKDLTGYAGMPTVFNSEGSYTVLDYTYKYLSYDESLNRYYTEVTRDYVYEQPYIGEIRGVNVSTASNYALRNTGVIESITDSSFTAATGYGIDNTLSYAAADGSDYARETVQIYYGTTPLAVTTNHLNETTIWFNRDQANIGEIDNVDITVESGNYGIQNAGIIDSITNTDINVASGNYAIGNSVRAATGEDVSKMENYIYRNDAGNYVATPTASITDKVWYYAAPTIKSIGEGNTLKAVSQTIYNLGRIVEIGSETGTRTTITATGDTAATQYAIYNYRGLVTHQERNGEPTTVDTNTGAQIDLIHDVSVNSENSVAIYNGDGTANALHPVIKEIAAGTEVTSAGANAIYNHATNAEIEKISGGIFTAGEGNFYALYNNSTTYPIKLSGGYYKGGTDARANAIYNFDNESRYIYLDEKFLSEEPKDVTFADGETGTDYYFVTKNVVIIIFDGNGGTGEMENLEFSLKEENRDVVYTFEGNAFESPIGLAFRFWSTDRLYSTEELEDGEIPDDTFKNGWSGTLADLAEKLGKTDDFQPGDEITLYAIWDGDASICTIEWGDMDFTYTPPKFVWNAYETKYEQTNPDDELGWSVENDSNTITVSVDGSYGYNATLEFTPLPGYEDLRMSFTGDELDGNAFTIPKNDKRVARAMLEGDPKGELSKTAVGTITIKLESELN